MFFFISFGVCKADKAMLQEGRKVAEETKILIKKRQWRKMFYSLANKHTQSNYLQFVLHMIADSGHANEVLAASKLAASSFSLFELLLCESMDAMLRQESGNSIFRRLPKSIALIDLAKRDEATYFFVHSLLLGASDVSSALSSQLLHSLISSGKSMGANSEVHRTCLVPPSETSLQLDRCVESMFFAAVPTMADIEKVNYLLKEKDVLSDKELQSIQQKDVFDFFLSSLFYPSFETARRRGGQESFCLLAFASCARKGERTSAVFSRAQGVSQQLESLYEALQTEGIVLDGEKLRKAVTSTTPSSLLCCLGFIVWAEGILTHPPLYQSWQNGIDNLLDILAGVLLHQPRATIHLLTAVEHAMRGFPSEDKLGENAMGRRKAFKKMSALLARISLYPSATVSCFRLVCQLYEDSILDHSHLGTFLLVHLNSTAPPYSDLYAYLLSSILGCLHDPRIVSSQEQWMDNVKRVLSSFAEKWANSVSDFDQPLMESKKERGKVRLIECLHSLNVRIPSILVKHLPSTHSDSVDDRASTVVSFKRKKMQ
mmetsp:Transcript_48067/g.124879  ORF Transcript_48067/g.124879 Transcript_48067/m.124879 type:complete len:544 (-) Transcript_48067:774-2405(-)